MVIAPTKSCQTDSAKSEAKKYMPIKNFEAPYGTLTAEGRQKPDYLKGEFLNDIDFLAEQFSQIKALLNAPKSDDNSHEEVLRQQMSAIKELFEKTESDMDEWLEKLK